MSKKNLRQYIRHEIKLAATIVIDNHNSIQCTILDFCSEGLFLELQQLGSNKQFKTHQKIQICFSVNNRKENKIFSLDCNIMHIRANGIGIAYTNSSNTVFEALKKESLNSVKVPSLEISTPRLNSPLQNKLEADLLLLLRETLPPIIRKFLQYTTSELPIIAEQVKDINLNSALLDTITNLSINKKIIAKRFCHITQETGRITLPSSAQIFKDSKDTPLSLIDKKDFEDWLNLSSITRNLESIYDYQLIQLEEKIAYLLSENKNNIVIPASPEKLCHKFRESLTGLDIRLKAKHTLYNILEATLIEFLPDLYSKMDATLRQHGCSTKIDHHDPHWLEINSTNNHAKNTYPQQTTNRYPAQQTTIANTQLSSNPSEPDQPALNPAVSSNQKTKPAINVAHNLLNFLNNHLPHRHQTEVEENYTQSYSTEAIFGALAQIQQSSVANSPNSNSPSSLEGDLSKSLNQLSSITKNLPDIEQNNIEVFERLIKALSSDSLISEGTQSYLQQIHIPLIAKAIQYPDFLESNTHPVRNIINNLSWLESAVNSNLTIKSTPIKESLDHLVDKIAKEPFKNNPDDSTIFTSIEKQLNNLTKSVIKSTNLNSKRVVEDYKGKQKLLQCRQFVQEELKRCFTKNKIPKFILSLLDTGWQHLLVTARLNKNNDVFQRYIDTIVDLEKWLSGSEKVSKQKSEETVNFIDTQLEPVCNNNFLHCKIIDELKYLLAEICIKPHSDKIQMVNTKTYKNSHKTTNTKHLPIEKNDPVALEEWLSFQFEQDAIPLKLVWIGEQLNSYVFVDINGTKKLDLEYKELVELLHSGKANRIESLDLPVMDRAINSMLQNMHDDLLTNATHDSTTELLNHKEFIKQIKNKISNFTDDQRLLICNIEIQDYRVITNACGLSGGSALLKQLASLLKNQLGQDDIIARLNDRTFSALFTVNSTETIEKIAKDLQSKLITKHFNYQEKSFSIAVGIGIMPIYPGSNYKINNIMQNIDSATLSAINAGRNRVKVYKDDDDSLKTQFNELEWIGRINEVLAENRLFLRCQRISSISPNSSHHNHYEILLGIKDEDDKTIPPDDFIPAVERCRRMSEIDQWVVSTVFTWIEEHEFDFEMLDGFSINLSGESINSEEFLEFLKHKLKTSKIPKEKITFEITETIAAGSFLFIQSFIKHIKAFGCQFSLDDFGSGYSSYAYLKNLDVDYLKIDGIFVKDILKNEADIAIVKSMNEIAHSLGLETIAEYVESDEIISMLKKIGVDYAQGWAIHKPMRLNELGL